MPELPRTMRAWRSRAKGMDGLALDEVEVPRPGSGEALLRVEAGALNFSDRLIVDDRYQVRPERPFTMGQEIAGEVVALGVGAALGEGAALTLGERVATTTAGSSGGFAEYAVVQAAGAMRVPDGFSVEDAATLPIAYMTATLALTESTTVHPGDTVLVLAAAGGVGLASVEIAAALGGTVIAAAGGAGKGDIALEHGAGHAVDYDAADWPEAVKAATGGHGVDIVVDNVGGERTLQALRLLAPGGRLLVVGFASGEIPQIPANRLLLKRASAIGVYLGGDRGSPRVTAAAARLGELASRGAIRPHVGARFRFEELPAALEALGSRRTTGKVLLTFTRG